MPKFMWAPMGKLVPQLPGVITFVNIMVALGGMNLYFDL